MNDRKILFCFTFAGGTAAFYDELERCLVPDICLVKLEYPGHGARHKEPLYENFYELSNDLYGQIKEIMTHKQAHTEYSLMGYSMGSIAVAEVLRKILYMGEMVQPKHIFLAAHEPVTKDELLGLCAQKADQYVKERTISFGGIPERLVHNHSFWRVYLPVYRADYTMIAKYRFEQLDLKTTIPVTVYYSETDTKFADMEKWIQFFVGKCDFVQYEGGHFFIKEHYKEMADIIIRELE